MRGLASAAGLALLVASLAGAARAQASGFEARRAAAHAELVQRLDEYVAWCQAKNLFASRQKACELLIELEPEHAEARKALGHTRAKDGTWTLPEKPKTLRDHDKKAQEEASGRWREATAGYVTAMVGLLEAGALSAEEQEAAGREALRLDPGNERVHVLLGEVKGENGWVLPETPRARERREELRTAVRTAFEGAPEAAEVELSELERTIPLKLEAFAAPGLRVVGTTGAEELRLCAQAVLALERLLANLFGGAYSLPEDCTVYLLAGPGELTAFTAHHPAISPELEARFARMEGGGIPGTNSFAFWTGDTQRRIDGTVRLVLGFWFSGAFQLEVRSGWAYEGFGLFLTRALVRSRLTWLATAVDPNTDLALRQRLIDPETNWMDEALRMMRAERQPDLGELVRKDASQLTTEDVLYAYTLVTYLLEARPEVVTKLLKRLGTGYPGVPALSEALGMETATFERRLERWLSERV